MLYKVSSSLSIIPFFWYKLNGLPQVCSPVLPIYINGSQPGKREQISGPPRSLPGSRRFRVTSLHLCKLKPDEESGIYVLIFFIVTNHFKESTAVNRRKKAPLQDERPARAQIMASEIVYKKSPAEKAGRVSMPQAALGLLQRRNFEPNTISLRSFQCRKRH